MIPVGSLNLPERFHRQLLAEVSRRPEVRRVILFGSRARGDCQARSDIDLAIEAPSASPREWSDLEEAITEDAETLLEVDLVRLEKAPPELCKEILSEGQTIYERAPQ